MTSRYALEATGLMRDFNGFRAVGGLRGIDLRVESGSIHALIEPNGAGKTTCFNLLTRFVAPTAGQIFFDGRDVTNLPPDAVAGLGLVRSFQISAVFAKLSVFENMRIALQRRRGGSYDWLAQRHGAPLARRPRARTA